MNQAMEKSTDTFLTMKDGTPLYYKEEIPENMKAMVIFVHGVGEHSGRYQYLAGKLYNAGYGILRFDLRGHGKSGGPRGFADTITRFSDDILLFYDKVKESFPDLPVYTLGHSMGSFISVVFAITHPGRLQGQILSGLPAIVLPLPEIRKMKLLPYKLFPMIRIGNSLGDRLSRDPEIFEKYRTDPLNLKKGTIKMTGVMFLEGPEWLSGHVKEYNLPCLLLHGGDDRIVTPASSEWFYSGISSSEKQRKVYPGLFHEIFNEPEKDLVIGDVLSWLDSKCNR